MKKIISTEKCPECGTPMIYAPFPNLGGNGVGITTSGDTRRPSWGTEKVCPNCGYTEDHNSLDSRVPRNRWRQRK